MNPQAPSPPWLRPAALFAVVTLVIVGLALWQPFAPSNDAPAADSGLVGDAAAGEALYVEGCAGCHGAAGEGGVGPTLADAGLAEAGVAGVIASGRGTMPAGIFEGQQAQDVAAFVAQLSGGEAAAPAPDAAPPVAAVAGDADRGETLFAETCAGCHGEAGSGGSAPALNGSPRQAAAVAGVIANGRGAMPAGLLEGADADDVAAYVARLSGAEDAAAVPPPPAANAGETAGRARLFGDNLWGLNVLLDEAAPTDWVVWVDGSAGLTRVGEIAAGAQELNEPNLGPPPIIDAYDRVVIGIDADNPAIVGTISSDDADRFRRINNTDPTTPEAVSLLDGTAAQIDVFQEHTEFLAAAVAENNPANLRFHSEHLVNIAEGEAIEELDGDGTPTNPGDGFGLIGKDDRDGYLTLLGSDASGGIGEQAEALGDAIAATVTDARECATAQTIPEASDCSASINARGARIAAQWTEVREAVERSLSIELVRPG